ncbi:MAG: hypothetical protein CVV06_05585 [Gammaproteobacteria bacterium HGW-Gammaproteobacteria-10]|nr:MAG: hypothetical protein CVV06_05585 [Gammaproteobacteria bacterium HGW-Gammaproteobacteria-10]
MDISKLQKHIQAYKNFQQNEPDRFASDTSERKSRQQYYESWTKDKILQMELEEFEEYIGKLWAMLIWGNKKYVTDKMVADHEFDFVKTELAELVWGEQPVEKRWDRFRSKIKGMGPAMISEILCYVHPDECMLWNRRAYVGLNYLGVDNLPRYNYQLTGKRYVELSEITKTIVQELKANGFLDADFLVADYFIWEELQVENNLSAIHKSSQNEEEVNSEKIDSEAAEFIHDEIRDKLKDIGQWLGLESRTEVKVADGSRVDTLWEQTIGNMGRVVYVFEVQTKGSIDSLILNLLKAVNNPAVQTVVAVSDSFQIEKIKKHASGVQALNDRLKYWDYQRVLEVHQALESVNEEINSLGLVPTITW